jgi:hypothetical protein
VKNAHRLFFLALVVVAMMMGCGGGGGQAPESTPSTAPAEPAAPAPTASAESIGVPECDEYLSKVEKCITDHVPDDMKAMQQQNMETMRDQWRQAAQTETGKATLAAGCKAALDAAKSSLAAYNCEW